MGGSKLMATEKTIESYLKTRIEQNNGLCLKFRSPSMVGVPDRICIMPIFVYFVEVKGPSGKLSSKQQRIIMKFKERGHDIFVIDSDEKVDALIEYHLIRLENYNNVQLSRLFSVPKKDST